MDWVIRPMVTDMATSDMATVMDLVDTDTTSMATVTTVIPIRVESR
ncbi:MAG: hypothetical protein O3B41_03735 [Bacteroidetes bacterium]|nr:hypothetical protein [Bacteroidota bacterium]